MLIRNRVAIAWGDVRRMLDLTAIDKAIPVFKSLDMGVAGLLAVDPLTLGTAILQ